MLFLADGVAPPPGYQLLGSYKVTVHPNGDDTSALQVNMRVFQKK
jgi:hypothetical protein